MKRFLMAIAITATFIGSARAESDVDTLKKALSLISQGYDGCKTTEDDKLRLACYDKMAEIAIKLNKIIKEDDEKKTSTAADETMEYKVVDASDIYVSSKKYINRPIEVRNTKCFYADVDEYRCLGASSSAVLIISIDITPASQKKALQDDCDSIKNISSRKCLKTLRFIPVSVEEDTISGYEKRKIILTRSMEVVAPEAPAARRRR